MATPTTPAAALIAAGIRTNGPIPFSRFMEIALYHPEHGYYRTPRDRFGPDPFGKAGDFFTASQLQPVFGRLVAAAMRQLRSRLGEPADFTVVEWGAGRGELAEFLHEFRYFAIDAGRGAAPQSFTGAVFCNELFDALPVDVVRVRDGVPRIMRIALAGDSFTWVEAEPLPHEWHSYVESLLPHFQPEQEVWLELPVRLSETLERMAAPLLRGAIVAIDYGYTARELMRFPRGTLMSYRRHSAIDDVLRDPGMQDITAHAPFTYIEQAAARLGLRAAPLETLANFILRTGEADHFASALHAGDEAAALRLRMQLKTLLFGMGETFRCLILER